MNINDRLRTCIRRNISSWDWELMSVDPAKVEARITELIDEMSMSEFVEWLSDELKDEALT